MIFKESLCKIVKGDIDSGGIMFGILYIIVDSIISLILWYNRVGYVVERDENVGYWGFFFGFYISGFGFL